MIQKFKNSKYNGKNSKFIDKVTTTNSLPAHPPYPPSKGNIDKVSMSDFNLSGGLEGASISYPINNYRFVWKEISGSESNGSIVRPCIS
jgi:hypothetical protein